MIRKLFILFSFYLMSQVTYAAAIEQYSFSDPIQEQTYTSLIHELRCLVCQNQTIGDSNAELAQDMRRKTYDLVQQGYTKQQVADFMAERYGDFVLYNPPFKAATAVLWVAPALLLLIAIGLLLRFIRRNFVGVHDRAPVLNDGASVPRMLRTGG